MPPGQPVLPEVDPRSTRVRGNQGRSLLRLDRQMGPVSPTRSGPAKALGRNRPLHCSILHAEWAKEKPGRLPSSGGTATESGGDHPVLKGGGGTTADALHWHSFRPSSSQHRVYGRRVPHSGE